MIIVLKQNAPDVQVHEFCRELEGMGLQINDSKGSDTHILGLIGDTKAIAESWVLANPVVEACRRVSEPYKKANRKFHPDDSIVDVNGVKIGGGNFAVIVPLESLICRPMPSSSRQNSWTCASGAFCFSTMIMVVSPLPSHTVLGTAQETGSVAAACFIKLQFPEA